MRLTLRTLLAYLDDTLEPAQAKLIGQKVAESDTAQELIARIREVTRRRRITTPTVGGPGAKVDPNTIAEYLDNILPAEQLAEVEQLALASDVHLAEIAACHQILTLVLGEPSTVPPLAYKRMYKLVKPPESNPNHRPPIRREVEEAPPEHKEVDETLRLGLPILRTNTWRNRLIVLGGVAAAFLLLAVAIWNLLPPFGSHEAESGGVSQGGTGRPLLVGPTKTDLDTKTKKDTGPKTTGKKVESKKDDSKKDEAKKDEFNKDLAFFGFPLKEQAVIDTPPDDAAPDPAVMEVGEYDPPGPGSQSVLLQLLPDKKGKDQWVRLVRGKDLPRVLSNKPLLSLPGYRSTVALDSKVRLTLWGNLPEVCELPLAQESLVVIHPNNKVALDLTLKRGRIAITNPTDKPLKVRVRFDNPGARNTKGEIWDVTLLEKGTEVFFNLSGVFFDGEKFFPDPKQPDSEGKKRVGPTATLLFMVQSGRATLRAEGNPFTDEQTPPPEGRYIVWTSRQGFFNPPLTQAQLRLGPWTDPAPEMPKDAEAKKRMMTALAAARELNADLSANSLDKVLRDALKPSSNVGKHMLALRSVGALDDIQPLIEALKDKEKEVRWTAIQTLWLWLGADPQNDYRLFDALKDYYAEDDRLHIMELLHGYSAKQLGTPATWEGLLGDLKHKSLAIRELANWRLINYIPPGRNIAYNATDNPKMLDAAVKDWVKLLTDAKVLPPPP
jgi:hypothetical protein